MHIFSSLADLDVAQGGTGRELLMGVEWLGALVHNCSLDIRKTDRAEKGRAVS